MGYKGFEVILSKPVFFAGEETEAQRGEVTCPEWHSFFVVKAGVEPESPDP